MNEWARMFENEHRLGCIKTNMTEPPPHALSEKCQKRT
jgi:hypothetical protein